jgi:uracil-DNA glycosylase
MIYPWKLDYWQTGEWQVCNERLKDMEKSNIRFNPVRRKLFDALRAVPIGEVQVAIIGQDPYPQSGLATGLAFSVNEEVSPEDFPPALKVLFKEYCSDLGYASPSHGDLSGWCKQGVLLWNAIPSCRAGASLSHDWHEYSYLTREIVRRLGTKGVVFAFLGSVAKRYLEYVDLTNNEVILTSHPSPRGIRASKTPFEGSRLFTTINDKLISQGLSPINWKLDDPSQPEAKRSGGKTLGGSDDHGTLSRILQNITGASCGPVYDARGVCLRE